MEMIPIPSKANSRVSLADSLREECGQDMIEYALVATIVAVGVIASVRSVQTAIVDATYNGISAVMSSF